MVFPVLSSSLTTNRTCAQLLECLCSAECDVVPLTEGSLALGTWWCLKVQYLYSHCVCYSALVCFCDCFLMEQSVDCVRFCLSLTVLPQSQQQSVFVTTKISHLGTVLFLVHFPPPVIPQTDSTQIILDKTGGNLRHAQNITVNSLSF